MFNKNQFAYPRLFWVDPSEKITPVSTEHNKAQGRTGITPKGSGQRRGRTPVQLFEDGKRGIGYFHRSGRQAYQVLWPYTGGAGTSGRCGTKVDQDLGQNRQ